MEESKEEPRRTHRSWRDRLLLFYGERHLEEKRGPRVAPAPVWAPLAIGSRCEVVVAADRRRLAGAAWDDIVARIRCCGRAGEPLELVVRKPNRGLDAVLDAIEAVGH